MYVCIKDWIVISTSEQPMFETGAETYTIEWKVKTWLSAVYDWKNILVKENTSIEVFNENIERKVVALIQRKHALEFLWSSTKNIDDMLDDLLKQYNKQPEYQQTWIAAKLIDKESFYEKYKEDMAEKFEWMKLEKQKKIEKPVV